MGEYNPRVGQDDRDGCFQFVGGVGHKLILLFPGLFHRAQGQAGEEEADEEKAYDGGQTHQQRVQNQPGKGGALPAHIGEGDPGVVPNGSDLKTEAQVLQNAPVCFAGQGLLHGLLQNFIRDAVSAAQRQLIQTAVGRNRDAEDRNQAAAAVRISIGKAEGKGPGVVPSLPAESQLQGSSGVLFQLPGGGVYQRGKDDEQHQTDQSHVDSDELQAQLFQHDLSSCF